MSSDSDEDQETELPSDLIGSLGILCSAFSIFGLATLSVLLVVLLKKGKNLMDGPSRVALIHLQFVDIYHLLVSVGHKFLEFFEGWIGELDPAEWWEHTISVTTSFFWLLTLSCYLFLSLSRYLGVCHPSFYETHITLRLSLAYIAISWLISAVVVASREIFGFCCAQVFHYHIDEDELVKGKSSEGAQNGETGEEEKNWLLLAIQITNAIVILAMVFFYVRVLARISQTSNAVKDSSRGPQSEEEKRAKIRERQIGLQFFTITIVFILLCIFLFIIQFIHRTEGVVIFLSFFYVATATADSAVILLFNPRIRQAAKQIFTCQ